MKVGNETLRRLARALREAPRGGKEPDLNEPFVFAAPVGFRFPQEAEEHFKERLRLYMKEFYGV